MPKWIQAILIYPNRISDFSCGHRVTMQMVHRLGLGDCPGDGQLAGRSASNGAYDSRHASRLQLVSNPTGLGSLYIILSGGLATYFDSHDDIGSLAETADLSRNTERKCNLAKRPKVCHQCS